MQRQDFKVPQVAAPLRQSVVGSIRDAILTGHYLAGERLVEKDLCDLTGVSRTLVREALRQLETEGLVIVQPNKGPHVVSISVEEARGIYDVRECLEGLAAELFARNATDENRQGLEAAFGDLKSAMAAKNPIEILRRKEGFYNAILAGTGNSSLVTVLTVINGQIRLLQSSWQRDPDRDEGILVELRGMVEALVEGDARQARRRTVEHVRNASKVALARLEAGERGATLNAAE